MDKRVTNLNLMTIKFPITAIVSILHRISGVVLFVAIPFLIWMLDLSLTSEQSFNSLQAVFMRPIVKLTVWLLYSALIYHLLAGIRHLLLDFGIIRRTKQAGKSSAQLILIVFSISILWLGVRIW